MIINLYVYFYLLYIYYIMVAKYESIYFTYLLLPFLCFFIEQSLKYLN